MVYTDRILVLTRPGSDELVDIVPLREILTVNGTEEGLEVDPFDSFPDKQQDEVGGDSGEAQCTLEIRTLPDGYNSGRVFKIRVLSKKSHRTVIEELTSLSEIERERFEAKSKYKRMQDKIAGVANSNPVQTSLAFLIIMVRFCRTVRAVAHDFFILDYRTLWSIFFKLESTTIRRTGRNLWPS
jgi:hypothetical protein